MWTGLWVRRWRNDYMALIEAVIGRISMEPERLLRYRQEAAIIGPPEPLNNNKKFSPVVYSS